MEPFSVEINFAFQFAVAIFPNIGIVGIITGSLFRSIIIQVFFDGLFPECKFLHGFVGDSFMGAVNAGFCNNILYQCSVVERHSITSVCNSIYIVSFFSVADS